MRRSQAALEFLTTYGWAFMIILVMIGSLSYFGVLDPSNFANDRCIVASPFVCEEFLVGNDGFMFKLRNVLNENLVLNEIFVETDTQKFYCTFNNEVVLRASSYVTVSCDLFNPERVLDFVISYRSASDSTGTFSRTAQGNIRNRDVSPYNFVFQGPIQDLDILSYASNNPELRGATALEFRNNFLYSLNWNDHSLAIIDASDKSNLQLVGYERDLTYLRQPHDLKFHNNLLYIIGHSLMWFSSYDVSDASNIERVYSISTSPVRLLALDIRDGVAYVVGRSGGQIVGSFMVFDISNPSQIVLLDSIIDDSDLSGATDIKIVGNYALVSGRGESNSLVSGVLAVVDISDPSNIEIVESFSDINTMFGAWGIDIKGNYAFVTVAWLNGIAVFDISNLPNLNQVAFFQDASLLVEPRDLIIFGNNLYVTDTAGNKIEVFDISNPLSIVHTYTYQDAETGGARYLYIDNPYLFLAAMGGTGYTGTIAAYEMID